MSVFSAIKRIAALPAALLPNALYFIRTGAGFDLYLSDQTGSMAHRLNSGGAVIVPTVAEADLVVPAGQQVLFTLPIDMGANALVVDGALIEVS